MMSRVQIALRPECHKRALTRAHELGVSFAEYVRRLIEADLRGPLSSGDPSALFDLGDGGPADVARDKDRDVGEAVAAGRPRR